MKPFTLQRDRLAALGLAGVLTLTAACSSSSKKVTTTTAGGSTASSTTAAAATIASKLKLGGAPECPTRPYCVPGLQKTYGITFASFKALDPDGPLTYAAVTSGDIDVALVFSTDALVADKGLVVLQDDKHLENADNIIPVLRTVKATPAVTSLLNKVSALITTDGLTQLNKKVTVDKADPSAVAAQFLKDNSLDTKSTTAKGVTLTVGSFNFSESALLAEIYGKALQNAGASVTIKTNLGTRETLEPGLQSGQLDLLPEYAATALEFINHSAGEASGDVTATVAKLTTRMAALGVTALMAAPAVDTNAFAVTKATATKYNLTKLSDLANPAP
jgi:osmoprotectant transport system substrate-binding protein